MINSLKEETKEEHVVAEDLSTRIFLSHKRSTGYNIPLPSYKELGQGIVGRLYEGMKDVYSIFLDSEAKFKIHNLQEIVKNTDNFLFLLTNGILLSFWCLQELLSALENKKRVRDLILDCIGQSIGDSVAIQLPYCLKLSNSLRLLLYETFLIHFLRFFPLNGNQ
jgi:hypothetical protein